MNKNKIILFTLGLLMIGRVNFIGVLTYSEIIVIILFALYPIKIFTFFQTNKLLKKIFFFWGLYFIGLIISDLLQHTPTQDLQRGWAKIGIFGLNILVIAYLSRLNINILIPFFLGNMLGGFINAYIFKNELSLVWKLGLGINYTILIILIVNRFPAIAKRFGFLLLILGIFHFYMNARSLAGMTLLTGILTIIPSNYFEHINPKKIIRLKVILPSLLIILTVYGIYDYGAPKGWFGTESQGKYLYQTSNNKSVLLAGRGESASAFAAIADSPIFGHGSWAKDKKYILVFLKAQMLSEEQEEAEYLYMMDQALIPTHSHLLGAWVEAGILGFIFWSIILRYSFMGLLTFLKTNIKNHRLLIFFILSIFSWDLFFSPFGLERRVNNAVIILMVVSIITVNQRMKHQKVFQNYPKLTF